MCEDIIGVAHTLAGAKMTVATMRGIALKKLQFPDRRRTMHTTTLRMSGNSIILDIPPELLNALQFSAGARVRLTVDGGCLLVEPASRLTYTLDELLSKCDDSAEFTSQELAWLNVRPFGKEVM
jgi:antitoxin ChpS